MGEIRRFQPGQTVILCEMWQNKIWSVRPEILVQDSPELLAFYMPEDTIWIRARSMEGTPATPEDRLQMKWVLKDEIWSGTGRLRLSIPGKNYSVLLFWNSDFRLRSWYINIEEPLHRTSRGFDYTDQILDIVAVPDLSTWYWKDEDELEEAIRQGIISSEKATAMYAEGEEAARWLISGKSPFNGWESWRPDPAWQIPVLPKGWDS